MPVNIFMPGQSEWPQQWRAFVYWPDKRYFSQAHLFDAPSLANETEEQRIKSTVVSGLKRIETLLSFNEAINLRMITSSPFNGFTCGPTEVLISTRAHYPYTLSSATVHELHHAKRMQLMGTKRVAEDSFEIENDIFLTLGHALISEGLAVAFEGQTGHNIEHYYKSVDKENLALLAKRASGELGAEKLYGLWFSLESNEIVPSMGGYALGHRIVSLWLKENDRTAANAVDIKSDEILNWWKARDYSIEPSPTLPKDLRDFPKEGPTP